MKKKESLNKEEAVKKAEDFAYRNGFDLSQYKLDKILERSQRYYILFEGKSGLPGDHFSVTVNTATKEVIDLVQGK